MIEIPLEEYQLVLPIELNSFPNAKIEPKLQHVKLTEKDKRFVKKYLSDVLEVDDELKVGIRIKSKNFIGSVNFEEFSIQVKPKVFFEEKNLFPMINYAFELDQIKKLDSDISYLTQENYLLNIVILSLVNHVKEIIRKGLYKSYVTLQDNTTFLKGKLLIMQQINNFLKNKPKFACEFDELIYDNLENQILLHTLKECYKITKHETLKKEIRKLVMQFSMEVSEKRITVEDIDSIIYSRLNHHYKTAHEICELVLNSIGIVDYGDGKHRISSFFVDMNKVFESFVARLLKDYFYPVYKVGIQKSKTAWQIDESKIKRVKTDILLENKKTGSKIVVDTKYKDNLKESDLYQIGFYIHEYESKSESGEKIGCAILPRYEKNKEIKHQEITESKEQQIKIYKCFIELNKIIPKLYDPLLEKSLKNDVRDLIPIK